ncbi:MAG UNVERIFIED_CONTAM: hypothetical protein LVR18_43810 [Planctomycetaceae bacterium]
MATKQPPGSRGPSTVVPPTPSIFAEQPRGDVLRASASSVNPSVKGAVAQAVHSSPVAEAGRSTGTQQTQHRSLPRMDTINPGVCLTRTHGLHLRGWQNHPVADAALIDT